MENEFYISCSFCITSKTICPEVMTELLGIEPDRSFAKGDTSISKTTGTIKTEYQNLWEIESQAISKDYYDVLSHIENIKMRLSNSLSTAIDMKNNPDYDISFWIWIEDETTVTGFDITETELEFINSIANWMHISFIGAGKGRHLNKKDH